VIYDEIKKRHENFVMDQRISCSAGKGVVCYTYGLTKGTKDGTKTSTDQEAFIYRTNSKPIQYVRSCMKK
jgi:hypothetical protein